VQFGFWIWAWVWKKVLHVALSEMIVEQSGSAILAINKGLIIKKRNI